MSETKLKKTMNITDYFMLGFGAMVGVGWSVSINGWFANGGGPLVALTAFLIGTLLMIPIGLCYAELTPAMPVAGGVVAFTNRAFGKIPSFIAGWFVVLAYVNVLPWEAIYINDVLGMMFPILKSGEPLYTLGGAGIYPIGLVVGIFISLFIIYINWKGSKAAIKFQSFLTGLLAITGIIIIIFSLFKANPSNLQPVYENIGKGNHSSFAGGLLVMLATAPFFLAGFDTIPQSAEEGSDKINFKNLGKVLLVSVIAAGGFYCLMIFSTGMALPWKEFAVQARPAVSIMFKSIYPGFMGVVLYWISLIAALAGLFTTWNGCFIAGARVIMGMARANLLPEFFAKVHPKYGTPYGGIIICSIATLAGPFIGIGLIDPLTIVGSTAFVVGWFFTAISCAKLRISEPDMYRPFKMPGGVPLALFAALIAAALVIITLVPSSPGYMGDVGIAYLVGWSILGIVFYIASAIKR